MIEPKSKLHALPIASQFVGPESAKTSLHSYLTKRQVLDRYRISKATWYRWIRDPKIAAPRGVKLGPQLTRWKADELDAFEARRAIASGKST